jgi:hypothetical protein
MAQMTDMHHYAQILVEMEFLLTFTLEVSLLCGLRELAMCREIYGLWDGLFPIVARAPQFVSPGASSIKSSQ